MLWKQARVVSWKKWVARHECEELRGGVWVQPLQAVLRRKTNEAWTDAHRHVTRKLVGGGGVQKIFYDIGWSDENKEEGTEKHRLYHCPSWREVSNQDPRLSGNTERGLEVARRSYIAFSA